MDEDWLARIVKLNAFEAGGQDENGVAAADSSAAWWSSLT